MARKCAAAWLESVGKIFTGEIAKHLKHAVGHYSKAWKHYEEYRLAIPAGEPTPQSLQQRARTPERISAIVPILDKAIEEEAKGIRAFEKAAAVVKWKPTINRMRKPFKPLHRGGPKGLCNAVVFLSRLKANHVPKPSMKTPPAMSRMR